MRCLSCQRQSFQSWSVTSLQNPRPAGRNSLSLLNWRCDGGSSSSAVGTASCLSPFNSNCDGGSSSLPDSISLCIFLFSFGQRTINSINRESSAPPENKG